jgi:ACS family glucarate transporter-like MFS transporter
LPHNTQPSNRWYVLILASLTLALGYAAPLMCMPVLFKEILDELGLNLVQVGTIWGMVFLAGLPIFLIGGMLGDRFGLKRIIVFSCFFIGIAGALRGLSSDFISLAATAFLYGILSAIIMTNMPRISKIWFSGQRIGIANGVIATGMSVGFTTGAMLSATVLSPWLGGWRNVLFLYGAVSLMFSMLWLFTVREPGRDHSSEAPGTVRMRQALSHVARLKGVWLLGFSFFGYIGCIQGVVGYLPLYLRDIGWAPTSADGTLAAFNIAGAIGAIPITLLSDKLGIRKTILIALMILAIGSTVLLPFFSNELVWGLAFLIGFTRDPCIALLIVMNLEHEKVSVAYAGTALGLFYTVSQMNGAISPPLGNSLASISLGTPFFFWAALAVMGAFILSFAKETGWKARKKEHIVYGKRDPRFRMR